MVHTIASTSPKTADVLAAANSQRELVSDSETYSRHLLGPVSFKLTDLEVKGTADEPLPPTYVAPGQSPFIIADNEVFNSSIKISFNKTPLSSLLMCLGTKITVNFHFEGQGRKAPEFDLATSIVTLKDTFDYNVAIASIPAEEGMLPGLYVVSATVEVGPVQHACSQLVLGYGYISDVRLQVYAAV